MTDIRLKLIFASPGARGDFVCGWTGLLNNVIDNGWKLDPLSGRSQLLIYFKSVKHLNLNNLINHLSNDKLELNASSNLFFVAPHHGEMLGLQHFDPLINHDSIQVYAIDHRTADETTLKWDCAVKSYLVPRKDSYALGENKKYLIDSTIKISEDPITDQQRIIQVEKYLELAKRPLDTYHFLSHKKICLLDYQELFRPGGSRYLCQQLELSASPEQHRFWDHMLTFATSPDEIECWGRVWRKSDYF